MTRRFVLTLALACFTASCTTVPAALTGLETDQPPPSEPSTPVAPNPVVAKAEVEFDDRLRELDTSTIFDGEVELQVPTELLALHPFGSRHVVLEFEKSRPKIEGLRKISGPWEGQLVRWPRNDPTKPEPTPLLMAKAHWPSWSLAPRGCDDARNQCYVREASTRWLEHYNEPAQGRAHGLLEIASSADEVGPSRYMLITTVARGSYVYALIYELHADEWAANEQLLRASARTLAIN